MGDSDSISLNNSDTAIKRRAEYDALMPYLSVNGQAYDNAGLFITGGDSTNEGLFQYSRETSEGIEARKKMCWNPNYATMLGDTMVSYPFKYQVERSTKDADIDKFMKATDVKGEIGMQQLMLKAHLVSYVYGWSYVVVDKPTEEFKSKLEESKRGQPYAYVLKPQDIVNWQYDAWGRLLWVWVLEPITTNALDPFATHDDENQYRVWTRDAWFLVDKSGTVISTGKHGLGVVPIVTVRYKDSLIYPDLGMTEFTSITQMQWRLFNIVSELDKLLRGSTFSALAWPGLGDLDKAANDGDTSTNKNKPTLSNSSVLQYDPESKNKPEFISPDSTCTDAYFKATDMIIAMMRETAKQKYNGGVRTSGVEAAYDFEATNTAVVSRALRLKDDEMSILSLVSRWMGKDVPKDLMIKYPKDFNIQDLDKEIDRIFQTQTLNISDTFNQELKKSAVLKLMPELTPEIVKKINNEIELAQKAMDTETFIKEGEDA